MSIIHLPYHPYKVSVTNKQRQVFNNLLLACNPEAEYYMPNDTSIEALNGHIWRSIRILKEKGVKIAEVEKHEHQIHFKLEPAIIL